MEKGAMHLLSMDSKFRFGKACLHRSRQLTTGHLAHPGSPFLPAVSLIFPPMTSGPLHLPFPAEEYILIISSCED